MPLARSLGSARKHLAGDCLRLLSGAPDALTYPVRGIPQFRGRAVVSIEELQPFASEVDTFSPGLCFADFVRPNLRKIATTAAPPRSRCRPYAGEISRETQPAVPNL